MRHLVLQASCGIKATRGVADGFASGVNFFLLFSCSVWDKPPNDRHTFMVNC
jgi:hypothetical protein